ncbi:MAG: phage major capsid protein [Clostridia bacterium]|nr:phage major capsid protein [Clostridia bacterium]
MISLDSAEYALKDAYLSVACNQLNTETNPLFAKIKQSSADVYGKNIIKPCQVGINGGIGAGSETGMLPTAVDNNYKQFKTTLKNLYVTIEISDKAIRASSTTAGAFVNLLNAEIDGLLTASKYNLSRMLYGDGSGKVCSVVAYDSATGVVTVDKVNGIMEGMVLDCYAGDAIVANNSGMKVAKVDRVNKQIAFAIAPATALTTDHSFYVQGSKDNEITGLGAIFGDSETLYGLNRADNAWLTPYISNDEQAISDMVMQTAIDTLEENSGAHVDFITCASDVRRAYQAYLAEHARNIDVVNLEGGFKAITFNGIPVVSDKFIEAGTLYLLDTSKFTLCQLCDWEWLEGEGGKIIRQKPGYPSYTATLVKYADLLCELPAGQAKFTNITTNV